MWTGLILAGGASRRMGRDKALLRLGGATLLERAVALVREAGGEPLVVAPARPGHDPAGIRRVDEGASGRAAGPLVALRHGLDACGTEIAVALACDLPLVPASLLRHLAAGAGGEHQAVVPRSGGVLQVLAAAYAAACREAIDRHLRSGGRSVHGFLEEVRVRYLEGEELEAFGGPGIFLNVNTPEDLARAEAILAARGAAGGAPPEAGGGGP